MLIKQPHVEIVSKIIRKQSGEVVCAYFALITIEGVREVKFLGFKSIDPSTAGFESNTSPIALLESPFIVSRGNTPVKKISSVFNPFYTMDLFVNQLARAPSFV